MSQNHFTLSFPLKSPEDAEALAQQLPPLMRGIFQAQDAVGTISLLAIYRAQGRYDGGINRGNGGAIR